MCKESLPSLASLQIAGAVLSNQVEMGWHLH